MLPGDLILYLLELESPSLAGLADAPERERGSLDPQTVAELMAYDIAFETPPASGFVFPSGADPG
jgi:hypothetical protein